MNKLIIPCLAAAFAASLCQAAPADDVKAAAKKLADAPNYSWITTMEFAGSQFGPMMSTGAAEKGGFTMTSRETQNGTSQTFTKGDETVMQNREGAWVTREEMMQQAGGGGQRRGGGMFRGTVPPAEQVARLVDSAKELKETDGSITGTLTAEAVAENLSFGGRGGQTPAPKNASGDVKFWLKDGALVKYQLHVKGTVAGRDGEEREVERTTTTEIKNVGSTKVTIPEEAKKKFKA